MVTSQTRESGGWQHRLIPFCFTAGACLMALGSYFGNKAIAASEGLLIIGFIALFVTGKRDNSLGSSGRIDFSLLRKSSLVLLLLVIWYAITIFVNRGIIDHEIKHLKKLRHLLIPVLLLLVPFFSRHLALKESLRKAVLVCWLFSMVVATLAGLIGHFTGFNPIRMGPPPMPGQASGIYGQVMTFAYSLQFSVILLGVILVVRRKCVLWTMLPGWVWFVCFGIASVGLYFTYARGAMLGVVTGALVFSWIYSKKIALAIVIVGILLGSLAYQAKARYYEPLSQQSIRISQWKTATLTFFENPFAGVGYGNFERVCADQKAKFKMPKENRKGVVYYGSHAHNNFLEAFASGGAVGGILFLMFCGFWFAEMWAWNSGRVFFVPVIAAFLVSGFFECTFSDSEVLCFVMLLYTAGQIGAGSSRDFNALGRGGADKSSQEEAMP